MFISVVPIFLIWLLNCVFLRSKRLREVFIYYLLSFAVGGLLGDVFFHTLPHMNSSHSHGGDDSHSHDHSHGHSHEDHGHSHNPKEMCNNSIVIAGIIVFFLLEKII